MLEASVWTTLKEFSEGIPRQGSVLTFFYFFDNSGMDWGPRGRICSKPIKKRFAFLPEILIEISNVIERS